VDTVKRHVWNVCGKLGVRSRAQAILRAQDLHLS
jgi:ATP/maltotriose-dependent transcriptional regulator MalT